MHKTLFNNHVIKPKRFPCILHEATHLLLRFTLAALLFVLTGCTPIQPVKVPTEQPATEQPVTPANTATPLSEEERIRAIVEASTQEIFAPSQPYSATILSLFMGMPALWVDYSVTKFDTLHGFVHSNEPPTIAYECEQTGKTSHSFPQPLPTGAVQFQPCNLPFQLLANILPESSDFSISHYMQGRLPEPTFANFVSLGQKEISLQLVPTGEAKSTRLADGYQFQSDTSMVTLWLDAKSGLPLLIDNVLKDSAAFMPFGSFSFLIQPSNHQ